MNETTRSQPAAAGCAAVLGQIISQKLSAEERSGRWLAARIGLSNAQLSRVVRGQSNVRLLTFIRICNALQFDASQVMADLQRLAQAEFALHDPAAATKAAAPRVIEVRGRSLETRPGSASTAHLRIKGPVLTGASAS